MKAQRFSYVPAEAGRSPAIELAYLPITLSTNSGSLALSGLLDTGSTVNVLPYTVGLALGFSWEQQTIPIALTGTLAKAPGYGVIVKGQVDPFPPIDLAFVWTQAADVPLILGQVNFFLEFDVCFFRAQGAFEVKPKSTRR